MSEYSMPVLSEQERESEIERCIADIWQLETTLKNGTSDNPHHIKSALVRQKIALAALTAKPVAFTAQSNLADFGGSVGYMWPPGNEKTSDVALYAKPPVPVIKQEGEQW